MYVDLGCRCTLQHCTNTLALTHTHLNTGSHVQFIHMYSPEQSVHATGAGAATTCMYTKKYVFMHYEGIRDTYWRAYCKHIDVHANIYIHTIWRAFLQTNYSCIYVHIFTGVHMLEDAHTYTWIYLSICIYIYTCMHTHTREYTCMHTHTREYT